VYVRQSHSMAKRWDAVIAEIGNDSAAGRQSPTGRYRGKYDWIGAI
jgi:hypothetical protein